MAELVRRPACPSGKDRPVKLKACHLGAPALLPRLMLLRRPSHGELLLGHEQYVDPSWEMAPARLCSSSLLLPLYSISQPDWTLPGHPRAFAQAGAWSGMSSLPANPVQCRKHHSDVSCSMKPPWSLWGSSSLPPLALSLALGPFLHSSTYCIALSLAAFVSASPARLRVLWGQGSV